jgi:thioredoxin 2
VHTGVRSRDGGSDRHLSQLRQENRLRPADDGVPHCGGCHHLLPWLVDATAETFEEELKAPVPVLVDFWAPWCGPCKWVSPAVAEQAQARAGKVKVVIGLLVSQDDRSRAETLAEELPQILRERVDPKSLLT